MDPGASSDRERFLARVSRVLRGVPPAEPSGPTLAAGALAPGSPAAAPARGPATARRPAEARLARFRAEAERAGTAVHRVATLAAAAERVLELSAARGVRRVLSWTEAALGEAAVVARRLRAAGLEVLEPAAADGPAARARWAAAELGLTGARLAVAETGSLLLLSGPGAARVVSLLPPCHVAVFGPGALVEGLEEAFALLAAWASAAEPGTGANAVLVTGPSRTADIELTLTRGVHGPREVHAVVVDALG